MDTSKCDCESCYFFRMFDLTVEETNMTGEVFQVYAPAPLSDRQVAGLAILPQVARVWRGVAETAARQEQERGLLPRRHESAFGPPGYVALDGQGNNVVRSLRPQKQGTLLPRLAECAEFLAQAQHDGLAVGVRFYL